MFNAQFIRVFTSFFVLGLALVQHTHAHDAENNDSEQLRTSLKTEPFLPVTAEQRNAWDRVIEHCLPLNIRDSLSAQCMTSLKEYFANEPVWAYSKMYVYGFDGWQHRYHDTLRQRRRYSPADFLNPDVPLWKHIFDDQIEQRQEVFLRIVKDSKCKEIVSHDNEGMHDHWAEHCEAREMYKYAAYLSACFDANHRLAELHRFPEPQSPRAEYYVDKNEFEISFQMLDEFETNEALVSAAKRSMEKSFLHAAWVATQCNQHGFILIPGETRPSVPSLRYYTSTEETVPWSALPWSMELVENKYRGILKYTHDFIMKLAMKSGDDWAIRSGYLGKFNIAEFSADLRQRYPLLMHRVMGKRWSVFGYDSDFTLEEQAQHRAKAYLLLVEKAGEEFARSEYDPAELTEEIQYVKNGGVLKAPATRAELMAKWRDLERKNQRAELRREAQGELTQ